MRTGYGSHFQWHRQLTPQERMAKASLLFEKVTSMGLCCVAPWLEQGCQHSADIACSCKAMGTTVHGTEVRPGAQRQRNRDQRRERVGSVSQLKTREEK